MICKRSSLALVIIWLLFFRALPVDALNKVNNWNFATDASGWTAANNGAGTDLCGSATTTAGESTYATFGYSSGTFTAITPNTKGISVRGTITQTFIAPGTGTVKAKGRFDYYGNGNWWSDPNTTWIRLDIYDSTNTTYIGSLSCISFNSYQAWQTSAFSSDINLTGGTTYTIRATLRAQTKSNKTDPITLNIDNIIVNLAPTGLGGSAPVDNTDVSLDWSVSTAGTGAPGLHATTPYKVFRDGSSPVSTFLANAATNSYTDSSTGGNTTYYFALSDVDTNSIESPLSAEVSVLTKPGAPATPTFSNIQATSLSVGWTAPIGGSPNYRLERAPDVSGSPGSWQEIATPTITSYDDSGLSGATTYWYRVRGYNGTGNGAYSSAASVMTAAAISISLTTDGSVNFDYLSIGSTADTTPSGKNDVEIISVDSGPADLDIMSTNFTQGINTWTLNSANGDNLVKWEFSKDGSSWTTFASPDPALYAFDTNVAGGQTRNLYFRITMPTVTSSYEQYSSSVTVVASAP
jgi:hypothetical protein